MVQVQEVPMCLRTHLAIPLTSYLLLPPAFFLSLTQAVVILVARKKESSIDQVCHSPF